jgi:hypothetical protein
MRDNGRRVGLGATAKRFSPMLPIVSIARGSCALRMLQCSPLPGSTKALRPGNACHADVMLD